MSPKPQGHSITVPSYTFAQLIKRIVKMPDSLPLLSALGIGATCMCSYIVYQFAVRPDFKALRIKSNATQGIDKPLDYYSNRLMWLGRKGGKNDTPEEVKELLKSLK